MRRTVLVLPLLAAACSSGVQPTNPYDPATPPDRQAKAVVRGALAAPTLASPGGLTVFLRANHQIVKQVQTAADGAFLVDAIVPGSYAVEASPQGFVPIGIPVTLAPGQELELGTLTLTPLLGVDAAIITGQVTLDSRTFHGGTLVEAVGRAFTAITDSSGAFRLEVSEGTYDLSMSHEGFATMEVNALVVSRGEQRALAPVQLAGNPATIQGDVVAELPAGGQGPLADAVVSVEGTSQTGLTDTNGHFVLNGVTAGSYLLRAVKSGYEGVSTPVLNLIGGETRVLVEPLALSLSRGGLAGHAEFADAPGDASGCIVEVTGTGRVAVTGSDGQFAFDDLLAGTYELSVRRDGYGRQVRSSLAVSAGATTQVGTVTLVRQGGSVVIAQGSYTLDRNVTLELGAATAAGFKVSEDPAFASPALGDTGASAWRPYGGPGSTHPFTLSSVDGEHTVYVVYFDGTSASSPSSAAIVLDRVKPTTPAITIGTGGAYTRDPIVMLTSSAQDLPAVAGQAVSGLANLYLGNSAVLADASVQPFNVTATWPLTAGDGPKTVWVWVSDRAGNVSDPAQAAVTLDRVDPSSPTIVLSGGAGAAAGYAGTPLVTAALSASDANEGPGKANLTVRLSNSSGFAGASWVEYATSVAWFVMPGDGAKTVWVQFRDPAGNESLPASGTISLLATPPSSGTLLLAGGAAATSSQTVVAAIGASGAATMRLFVNGVPVTGWDPYATSTTVNLGASPDEATRVVSVSFRNAAGVEGGGTSATIRYDRTAPGAGAIALLGALGNGAPSSAYTAAAAIVAAVTPPGTDASELALAQVDPAVACSTAFAVPGWQPLARTTPVVLTGADGMKRVCVLFRDTAGNFARASAVGADLRLDTVPPSNPALVNVSSATTRSGAAPAVGLPVVTAAADAGAGGVTYQCIGGIGGAYGANWVDCGTSTTLPAAWALSPNQEVTLGVRARDAAYNASPGSFVRIVQDSVAPFPPFITDLRSSRETVTVAWDGTGDADVAQYLVHYGNVAGALGGTGAAQGPSPVAVGAFPGNTTPSFTLTGLTPGLPYYVAIEAVDAAGNRSGPSGERLAVPARANPRVLSTFFGQPRALATVVETFDDANAANDRTYAYLGENQGFVQLDVSSDTVAPPVIGRAHVPDLVPDARNGVVAFRCAKGAAKGHCVVAAGATLEGDYRDDVDRYRASAPIVFFPTGGTVAAPTIGTVEGVLPGRPSFVFAIPSSQPGETLLYTVDARTVRAFSMPAGQLSRLREVASVEYGFGLVQSVLGATLAFSGQELYVFARLDVQYDSAPELFSFETGEVLDGSMYELASPMVLLDSATAPQHALGDLRDSLAPKVTPVMGGGGYFAFEDSSGVWVASYAGGNPNPQSKVQVGVSGMAPLEAKGSAGIVNGHLYVTLYGGDDGYAASLLPVTGLTLGTPENVPMGTGWTAGGAAATLDHLGRERLFIVCDTGAGYSLQRWSVSGTTATHLPAATLSAPNPTWFAEADRFLYVSDGRLLRTLDVSNPLTPTSVSTYTGALGRSYRKVVAHGRYLYALDAGSLDVLKRNGDGTLTLRATVTGGSDLAVAGRYLFVATGGSILAYDVASIATAAPAAAGSILVAGASALDARIDSYAGVGYPAIVYVSQGSDNAAVLQAYTYSGAAFSLISAASYPGRLGTAVTVRGDYVAVSSGGGTWTFGGAPTPFLTGPLLPIAGPTLLQAGYAVGLAPDGEPNGPAFALRSSATVDGAVRFEVCGRTGSPPGGSLAHSSGLYAASCGRNGITLFTPAAREGGRLVKSFEVSPSWSEGAALGSDGMYTWFGGAQYGADASRLYQVNEQTLADGTSVTQPIWAANLQNLALTGADPGRAAVLMQQVDGALFIATASGGSVTLDAYDPTGWLRLGRYTFPTSDQPTAIASDGDYLYVARGARLDVVDVRTPSSMTLRATTTLAGRTIRSLAHARDRLYAGLDLESELLNINEIRVWDTASIHAGTLAPKVTIGGWEGSYVGVAVSGRLLFGALHDWNYRAPLYGLNTIVLGADRDGAGASSRGVVPSDQPLASPVVAGDTLYVASNLGTRTYDLTSLWQGTPGALPVDVGGVNLADPFWTDGYGTHVPPQLRVEGPFGFLVGGSYRVFDLR